MYSWASSTEGVALWLNSSTCPVELRVSQSCSTYPPVIITLMEFSDEVIMVEVKGLEGDPILSEAIDD